MPGYRCPDLYAWIFMRGSLCLVLYAWISTVYPGTLPTHRSPAQRSLSPAAPYRDFVSLNRQSGRSAPELFSRQESDLIFTNPSSGALQGYRGIPRLFIGRLWEAGISPDRFAESLPPRGRETAKIFPGSATPSCSRATSWWGGLAAQRAQRGKNAILCAYPGNLAKV